MYTPSPAAPDNLTGTDKTAHIQFAGRQQQRLQSNNVLGIEQQRVG
jgi:hypothetical protein